MLWSKRYDFLDAGRWPGEHGVEPFAAASNAFEMAREALRRGPAVQEREREEHTHA
jgi:hypothetical protein